MVTRKRKYIPHLAEFYHNPDSWTDKRAEKMFRQRTAPIGPVPLDTVLFEDCINGMIKIPNESVDLTIADPPFGIDFDGLTGAYNRDSNNVVAGYKEVKDDYHGFSLRWLTEAKRVMKPRGSAYIFSGWNNLDEVIAACKKLGLETVNHIIWKYNFGLFTRRKFVTSHYHILLVVKDLKQYYFNKVEHYPNDVWDINREYRPGEQKNATKLPSELVRRLLTFSSRPGDIILDPFMGNGTTAVASKQLWRHFIGFEFNEDLREVIASEIDAITEGEKYRWFDKRSHVKELRIKYPRAAQEYDLRRLEKIAENA